MAASLSIYSSPDYSTGSPAIESFWYAANNPLVWLIQYNDGSGGHTPAAGYLVRVIIKNESSVEVYRGYYSLGIDGYFYVRLDAVLKELLVMENTFNYDVINKKEDRLSHKFNIDIQGGTNLAANPDEAGTEVITPFDRYVLHSVLQIGSVYGANMYEYVTQDDGAPLAKFLTKLTYPKYWPDYPFCIDFIWNHQDSVPTSRVENTVANDGTVSADDIDALTRTANIEHLNHMQLAGGYSGKKEVMVHLIQQYMGSDVVTTEIKTILIQDETVFNPLYIRFINELAGTDHWLFNINQIKQIGITDQQVKKLYVDNLITGVGTHQTRSSRKALQYSIGCEGLSANEWDVLSQQLGGSIYCQVWNAELSKFFNAIVVPANYERNTKAEPYKIELNLILPEIFNQSI